MNRQTFQAIFVKPVYKKGTGDLRYMYQVQGDASAFSSINPEAILDETGKALFFTSKPLGLKITLQEGSEGKGAFIMDNEMEAINGLIKAYNGTPMGEAFIKEGLRITMERVNAMSKFASKNSPSTKAIQPEKDEDLGSID